MNQEKLAQFVERAWNDEAVPLLVEYIKIPNKSPEFDKDWEKHGHMERAVELLSGWAKQKVSGMKGATLDVLRLPGRTPLIVIDIPGATKTQEPVLLYGHLDKQPEMVGWTEGTGPWIPVIKDDKLYGRGGADDGYAIFAALSAIGALREQSIPHARCVVLIEASEESGSPDLPFYIDHLASRLGTPSLVVCLDSGCGNYDQLWLTTSLRGLWNGTVTVRVLEEGVHSGSASGIVPSSFRIFRQLLSRIEDEATGAVVPEELYVQIPADRIAQAKAVGAAMGDEIRRSYPFAGKTKPVTEDPTELILNRTWRPQLAITTRSQFPTLQAELPATQRRADLAAGLGVVVFDGPQGHGFFKGGHDEQTGNTMVCLRARRRCLLLMANDVRAEAGFDELVRFVLGDTGVPFDWEYGDHAGKS